MIAPTIALTWLGVLAILAAAWAWDQRRILRAARLDAIRDRTPATDDFERRYMHIVWPDDDEDVR